jgi:hypothetical protein
MHITRFITLPLAAVLGAAAVAGPAAAVPADWPHNAPTPWYAGTPAIQGSRSDGQDVRSPSAMDAATADPQPIGQPTAVVNTRSAGFDWGSAGIGAAAAIGALAIALAGTAGMRRRRPGPPGSVATH